MDGSRFDRWTRERATGTSRRNVLRGLAGGAVVLTATALGRTVAVAAPSQCSVIASQWYPPGPARAAFSQACRRCDADISRICQPIEGTYVCCPAGEICCFNGLTESAECGVRDPNTGYCVGTEPI
jgi:hypothetical protein